MDSPASSPPQLQPPPPRRPLLGGLTFRAPAEPETTPSPADLPPLSPPAGDSASASDSGWQPDEQPAPHGSDPSSSAGSTPEPERVKVVKPADRAAITRTAIAVVEGAGTGAHHLLAKDEIEQHLHVYEFTEREAEQIGTPLGSIAARHSGGLAGVGNPDVNDGIAALVGLAVYAVRQLNLRSFARQVRAGQSGEQLQPPPGPADTARDV